MVDTTHVTQRNLDIEEPYAGNWLVRICGGAGCHTRDAQLYPEKYPCSEPRIHLWSELRTSLRKPTGAGRVYGIQPDYVLAHEPITHPAASLVVVECKQYLRPSKRRFASALQDYASGHPNASVILVNYGPASQAIVDSIPVELRDRVLVIGDFRPRSDLSLETFKQAVGSTLMNAQKMKSEPIQLRDRRISNGEVRLTWGATPNDLDLHCLISQQQGHHEEVFYDRKHFESEGVRVEIDRDIRKGYGPETIRLECSSGGQYHFAVYNYSNDASLTGSSARIEAICGETRIVMFIPAHGDGRWWDLFELNAKTGTVKIVNQIVVEHPNLSDSGPYKDS